MFDQRNQTVTNQINVNTKPKALVYQHFISWYWVDLPERNTTNGPFESERIAYKDAKEAGYDPQLT